MNISCPFNVPSFSFLIRWTYVSCRCAKGFKGRQCTLKDASVSVGRLERMYWYISVLSKFDQDQIMCLKQQQQQHHDIVILELSSKLENTWKKHCQKFFGWFFIWPLFVVPAWNWSEAALQCPALLCFTQLNMANVFHCFWHFMLALRGPVGKQIIKILKIGF